MCIYLRYCTNKKRNAKFATLIHPLVIRENDSYVKLNHHSSSLNEVNHNCVAFGNLILICTQLFDLFSSFSPYFKLKRSSKILCYTYVFSSLFSVFGSVVKQGLSWYNTWKTPWTRVRRLDSYNKSNTINLNWKERYDAILQTVINTALVSWFIRGSTYFASRTGAIFWRVLATLKRTLATESAAKPITTGSMSFTTLSGPMTSAKTCGQHNKRLRQIYIL